MPWLVLRAYWQLIRFNWYLARGNFAVLYSRVHSQPIRNPTKQSWSVEQICRAVDVASIWYWKRVLCLQRSAATASLLKQHGFGAEMVIGARQMPFKAHAWVEVAGRVVNDKPYTPQVYPVLEKC